MRVCLTIFALFIAVLCVRPAELRGEAKGSYSFEAPAELSFEVGTSADLSLAISPAKGFRVDKNAPVRIELRQADESRVSIKKSLLRRRDAVDAKSDGPRFRVPLMAKSVGTEVLVLRYRFWLCQAKICHPIRGEAIVGLSLSEAHMPDGGPLDAAPAAGAAP